MESAPPFALGRRAAAGLGVGVAWVALLALKQLLLGGTGFAAFTIVMLWAETILLGIGVLGLILEPDRRVPARRMAFLVPFTVATVASVPAETASRGLARARLVRRAEPLVAALHGYEADHGRPASELEALVPRYLPRVPRTGLPAYPRFEYRVAGQEDAGDAPLSPGSRWELRVDCTDPLESTDVLLYWPTEEYPDRIPGAGVSRVGRWAHVGGW